MKNVLIVEDEEDLLEGLAHNFKYEGYEVMTARTGPEGLKLALKQKPDLVVLDIMLPEKDGFTVLKELRQRHREMPVLVITARNFEADVLKGFDLGADDYMVKPFAMPELVARVRALIRRSQAQSGPRIVHGPLTLDTVARRAFLRGAPLDLAAREWAVLEVLLARVERIVSKESIIQAVASWGDELSPNAIEVYVSRLRAKLEPAGVRIRTVRGFGYMLEEYAEAQ